MGKYGIAHIGKTFNDGKLVVVDGGDKPNRNTVKCLVCAVDAELHGNATYQARYDMLERGSLPCGCSSKPKYTLSQYEVKIKRKIESENLPVEFVGFGVVSRKISDTNVKLWCTKNSLEYEIRGIQSFLQGTGNNGKSDTYSELLAQYNKTNPNTTVWDSGKRVRTTIVCGFHCKVCEREGLESLFEIEAGHLLNGSVPCYCSGNVKLTGDAVVEMAKLRLHEQGLQDICVIGAFKKRNSWYSVFMCNKHGVYSRLYGNLKPIGCYCLKCSPPNFGYDKTKQGSLYLLEIQTDFDVILGYGITSKLGNRLTTHRKNLKELGYKILSTRIFEGSGTRVLSAENAIKSLHKTGLIDCEGFRRESISIDRKEEVLGLCAGLTEIKLDTTKNIL